jgi:hypothetical protein
VQLETRRRILAHAERCYSGRFVQLNVRFRGCFCYMDAFCEPDRPTSSDLRTLGMTLDEYVRRGRSTPIHLCRLRYFGGRDRWSVAFFAYSHERYEPCLFPTGEVFGTPEEAFDIGAVYLQQGAA